MHFSLFQIYSIYRQTSRNMIYHTCRKRTPAFVNIFSGGFFRCLWPEPTVNPHQPPSCILPLDRKKHAGGKQARSRTWARQWFRRDYSSGGYIWGPRGHQRWHVPPGIFPGHGTRSGTNLTNGELPRRFGCHRMGTWGSFRDLNWDFDGEMEEFFFVGGLLNLGKSDSNVAQDEWELFILWLLSFVRFFKLRYQLPIWFRNCIREGEWKRKNVFWNRYNFVNLC